MSGHAPRIDNAPSNHTQPDASGLQSTWSEDSDAASPHEASTRLEVPPDTPLPMLMHCHRNIRRFTEGLERLALAEELGEPACVDAARSCARYFREALPLHAEDEDLSVAPRLDGLPLRPDEVAARWRMFTQHQEIEALCAELLPMLQAIGDRQPVDRMGLLGLARELGELQRSHLELEETVLFPRIEELPTEVQAEIAHEMRERRGIGPSPQRRSDKPGLAYRVVVGGS